MTRRKAPKQQHLDKIIIRKARLCDVDTLVEQRHRMFQDIVSRTPESLREADRKYKKWMIQLWRQKRFVGFLAMNSVEVVGGGCVWIKDLQPSPTSWRNLKSPYLLSMYTDPKYRRRGIASSIVKEAMLWSRKKGYNHMTLHASKLGRPVYSRLGWRRSWEMIVKLPTINRKIRNRR